MTLLKNGSIEGVSESNYHAIASEAIEEITDATELQIVQIPGFTTPIQMPTFGEAMSAVGKGVAEKVDQNIIAPAQLAYEEVAMNVKTLNPNSIGKGLVGVGSALTNPAAVVVELGAANLLLSSCETDEIAKETQAQKEERWHQEAEAEATRLGWSQGVKSLAAGEIDYYYYKEKEGGPILIRLSYKVDVNDFINKIETDAKNRGGIYDPKTEGFLQATLASLEGDNKNNVWFVPSSAIYEAKSQGKDKLNLEVGTYPSPNAGRNTIAKNEGINPNKQMQIYSFYGNKNWTKVEDAVKDQEKEENLKTYSKNKTYTKAIQSQ